MLILDLFCGAGGASAGYARAGWTVVGIDNVPQPNYPFTFIQADALAAIDSIVKGGGIDAVHASPPCQKYSKAQRLNGREHPDLIAPTRAKLLELGLPYVIENVPGAPLIDPVELCGCMFKGLNVYRERLFEASFPIRPLEHTTHPEPLAKMGRPPQSGERMYVVGHFSGVEAARRAMDIPWMKREELREAIPPAYTEYIGRELGRP